MIPLVVAVDTAQPPAVSEIARDNIQHRFLEAITLVNRGYPALGAAILEILYKDAPTPRIRLEFARALMMAGELRRSRQIFIEAYDDNPPLEVRINIQKFLGEIDKKLGKFTYGVSAGLYSNPLQQPDSYNLNLAGIDLTFEADNEYKNVFGYSANASYQKTLNNGGSLSVAGVYQDLAGDLADRTVGEALVSTKREGNSGNLGIGIVALSQKRQSYTAPYIQASFPSKSGDSALFEPSIRLAYQFSGVSRGLSGWQLQAALPYLITPSSTRAFVVGPTITRHNVRFAEQSYMSVSFRLAGAVKTEHVNFEFSIQARRTRFDAVDPFWGVRRKDRAIYGGIAANSDRLRIGGVLPTLELSCDVSRSTVNYYTQKGCDAQIGIRTIF